MIRIQRAVLQNSGRPTRVTRVRLTSAHAEIRFEIAERFTTRQRRAVVNSLLRHMKPWLKFFEVGRSTHEEEKLPNFAREESRMSPWLEGEKDGTPIEAHSLGLLIRLKRTGIGMTQQELADQSGLSRWQVVQIEMGRMSPRESTLKSLMQTLRDKSNPTQPNIRRSLCGKEDCPQLERHEPKFKPDPESESESDSGKGHFQ